MNNIIPMFYGLLNNLLNGQRILAIVMLTIGLNACSGDDGAPGQPGLTPGVDIANAQELNASITGVTVASQPVVTFRLTDGNGNAVKNLPADSIDFSFVQLIPGTDGNASAWQSYINEEMQPGAGGTGTVSTILASSEKGTEGILLDNDDGTYQYTFALDVTQVTSPLAVAYQPALTHRVTFRVQGFAKLINPIYDFRPSDGATSNLFSRAIVNTESCNSACHEQLVKHRSARFNTENCSTCHNPGSIDATTENTLDMTVMFHKIHRGEGLPSVVAGGDYCIDHNGLVCFDDVVHPQDIRNCETCHNEDDPATPDAANWYKMPTAEACGACHDDVNFATGENHGRGIVANNSMCTTCHTPDTTSALGAYQTHRILIHEDADRYDFNILDVTSSGAGTAPVVTFSVTDPGNNNAPYDLANDADLTASRLLFYLAWDTTDYTNPGNNNGAATSTDIYTDGALNATDNGDMTYTLTLGIVPADATGTGIVSFSGSVSSVINELPVDLPVRSTHQFFGITDDPANPVARRAKVDLALCDNCHQRFGYHGNRNQDLDNCAMCHNPAAARGGDPSRGPMDFKSFVHRKHAIDDIRYPQRVSNCLACHTEDGFYPVEADSGVLSTSINRGDDTTDSSDNNKITPNTAACSVCHASASAKVHMELNGGHFDVCQENDGTTRVRVDVCGPAGNKTGAIVQEGCTTCHAKGRSADTATAHSID